MTTTDSATPANKHFIRQIIEADIVENVDQERVLWEKQDLLRHDPAKLARAIMELR